MGGLFGIILVSFTFLVMMISLWCCRYLCYGRLRKIISVIIILFDGGTAWFLMRNDHWLYNSPPEAGLVVVNFIVIFMLQIIASVLIILAVIVRWSFRRMLKVPEDASRRRLLKKAVVYPAAAAGMSFYGGFYERTHTVERCYDISVPDIELAGYKIAQLSDIHLGLFFRVSDFKELLIKAADSKADMLVITGDLFDDVKQNEAAAKVLDSFCECFPDGIWYCLGNHEYYRGLGRIKEILAKTKVHTLYNQSAKVGNQDFWLAGVEYSFAKGEPAFYNERQQFLQQAMTDNLPAKTILLAHHPEFIDNAAVLGIPLTLTGHTHGSQFGIFGLPLFPVFKYTRGMVKLGSSYGYVHSGNGSWFPFRFGCPPEIAYFILNV